MKSGMGIVAGLLLGGAVFAEELVSAEAKKNEMKPIASLDQVAELTKSTQKQFWQLIPPMDDPLYIHPESTVRSVDWTGGQWPDSFLKRMTAKMESVNGSLYPIYRMTVVEERTGELVYYNSRNREVWRTPAPLGYNPYLFAFEFYGLDNEKELTEQQRILGRSSNVGMEITLLPEVFMASYEQDVALEEQAATLAEPMPLAMAAPLAMGSGVELQMEIGRSNGIVEVFVEWLGSLDSDSLDLFLCSDLIAADWQLQTNFPTASSTNFYFCDLDTNETARFYATGTDFDEDLDGLASARERYLYKTREDLFSTDCDGLGDGWEILYGFDPFSTDGTNGALGDADNDGFSNLEEQLNGSDPGSFTPGGNIGTVATIRYHYDEDDRLTDFYSGAEVAGKTILTATHNIAEEVSAK